MRNINKIAILLLSVYALSACASLDTLPEGSTLTGEQKKDVTSFDPDKAAAELTGMYASIGKLHSVLTTAANATRADDFGYPVFCADGDLNGPDMTCADIDYNWLSVSSRMDDRDPSYANPTIRWGLFWNQIKIANDIIKSFDVNNLNDKAKAYLGQALAVRAFDYFNLLQYYQFTYKGNETKPGVPIITENSVGLAFARDKVEDGYAVVMNDLNKAIEYLDGYSRKSKDEVNLNVALGLRARVNLVMQNWDEAAADAKAAISSFVPLSKAEAGKPGFIDASKANVMWAIFVNPTQTAGQEENTWAGSYSSFVSSGYAVVGCYKGINKLLWDKIPASDVRKGWWVDENLESPLLEGLTWNDGINTAQGQAIAKLKAGDKVPFLPYTNVKYGAYEGKIGTKIGAGDWGIMRVEEMYLIQAEAEAMGSAGLAVGRSTLESFVKTYRNDSYVSTAGSKETFQTVDVWFQRRVELWGEGFSIPDIMRLKKPIVRIHGSSPNFVTSFDPNFQFNLAPTDPWLLLRIPQTELNGNPAMVQNTGGSLPQIGANAALRDGVTD